jgi:L-fucose isomerase-like protein
VAALRYYLRRARIGYLGHRVEGMTETTAHELALKRVFGPRVVGIDSQVFLEGAAKVESEAVQERWRELKDQVGSVKCGDEDGLESLKIYTFLSSVIEEKMLSAVAIGCYPHLMGRVCLSASLLGEEGIPIACEGDINGALGMMILSWLSSEATHNTDLLNPIPEDNAIVFSHCGSGGFSLAKDISEVTFAPVRLMDKGLCCLFTPKPGPVTLVNIIPTMGSYKMGVMEGYAVETDMVFPGNPLKVRFESDYREILSWIADEGLGHHWMAAYGTLKQELVDLADMVGCTLKSVS